MDWIDKMEKRFGGLAIKNLAMFLIIGQIFVFAGIHFGMIKVELLYLNPILIMKGEIWRIISFIFIPPLRMHPIFLAFAWYIFWLMSQALEGQWGIFKFNLFIWMAILLTFFASILFPYYYYSNNYIALTVFLAFATLYPNFQFMLFFILPVKVKYLAWISLAGLVYAFIMSPWPARVVILVSLGNYALFFGRDLYRSFYYRKRRIEHQKKAHELADKPFHTCVTCGATEKSNPEREFRYREGKGICGVCLTKEANTEA